MKMHPLDGLAEGVVQHDFLHYTKAARPPPEPVSRLNVSQENLNKVFSKYFEYFAHCAESARLTYTTFANNSKYVYEYEPIRTISADLPAFLDEKNTSLADYDKNDGLPFWLKTEVQPMLNA